MFVKIKVWLVCLLGGLVAAVIASFIHSYLVIPAGLFVTGALYVSFAREVPRGTYHR